VIMIIGKSRILVVMKTVKQERKIPVHLNVFQKLFHDSIISYFTKKLRNFLILFFIL